jgi:NAD(P)H dehydrogenase (quinone)
MNVLVMYCSRTGKTKAPAEEVADGVREVEGAACHLKTADEVTADDFVSAAAIVAGSPVFYGSMAAELKAVFDRPVTARKKMGGKVGDPLDAGGHHGAACCGAMDAEAAGVARKLGKRVANLAKALPPSRPPEGF